MDIPFVLGITGFAAIAVLLLYVVAWVYCRTKMPRFISVGVTVVLLAIAVFIGLLANG